MKTVLRRTPLRLHTPQIVASWASLSPKTLNPKFVDIADLYADFRTVSRPIGTWASGVQLMT